MHIPIIRFLQKLWKNGHVIISIPLFLSLCQLLKSWMTLQKHVQLILHLLSLIRIRSFIWHIWIFIFLTPQTVLPHCIHRFWKKANWQDFIRCIRTNLIIKQTASPSAAGFWNVIRPWLLKLNLWSDPVSKKMLLNWKSFWIIQTMQKYWKNSVVLKNPTKKHLLPG